MKMFDEPFSQRALYIIKHQIHTPEVVHRLHKVINIDFICYEGIRIEYHDRLVM